MSQENKPDVFELFGISPDALREAVNGAKELKDNQAVFEQLTAVTHAKKALADALESVESIESDAKGLINAKAKALYGNDWQVIEGEKFKINRVMGGAVYELADPEKVADDFLKVTVAPNARKIDEFRETNENKLPEGVALNERRSESIRIKVNG